jgi:predicted  nucleic acid-binding Zn-ribbon protein
MGRQLSTKRKAHISSLPASRWKHKESAKENIIPPELIPPRAATRAQNYIKTLENTISDRNTHILALQLSNADLTQQNTSLSTQLDTTSFRIRSLELDNTSTSQELSITQEQLNNAHDLISTQSSIITQKTNASIA